jgi:hypothetical protein
MTCLNQQCQSKTNWAAQAPGSMHAYRVSCSTCQRFRKWGTCSQLEEAREAGTVRNVARYQAPATLEAFL